jgi:predicted GNAT family N-acyltransferase
MSGEIRFSIAETADEKLKVFVVRGIVFCGEQQVPYSIEWDEHESSSLYVLGQVGDEPIAAGRIRFFEGYAKLERIAVRAEYRGQGYGHGMTDFMIQTAKEKGFLECRMHAQVYLKEFYAEHGFEAQGDVFTEAGIDHVLMVRNGS